VARLTEKRGPATLTRIDGKRAALVNGRADTATITPIQARRQIGEGIIPDLLERYPGLKIEIHGAARDSRAMLETLGLTVPLVLLAMYALMAAFLRSYWKPLVAVVGIPIAFAGSVMGHWILGWDFTAMSLFGVIGVAGVIVNDALVLMDRYNTIRRDNDAIPAIAAVSAATRHRFRAVLLTSLTTVLGLSPLLYERSDELLFLVPLVVSMLGGLVLSGLFILFILPTLVMIAEGRRE
jgi:multidrug efflux pump subunit AcrB